MKQAYGFGAVGVVASLNSDDTLGASVPIDRYLSLAVFTIRIVLAFCLSFHWWVSIRCASFSINAVLSFGIPLSPASYIPQFVDVGSHGRQWRYHLVECQCIQVHDALVWELEKCREGAIPLVGLRNSLLSSPLDRPKRSIQYLDDSGKTFLVDVTTGESTPLTYVRSAACAIRATASSIETASFVNVAAVLTGRCLIFPLRFKVPGRWEPLLCALCKKIAARSSLFDCLVLPSLVCRLHFLYLCWLHFAMHIYLLGFLNAFVALSILNKFSLTTKFSIHLVGLRSATFWSYIIICNSNLYKISRKSQIKADRQARD